MSSWLVVVGLDQGKKVRLFSSVIVRGFVVVAIVGFSGFPSQKPSNSKGTIVRFAIIFAMRMARITAIQR